jgi:hypothetical protein
MAIPGVRAVITAAEIGAAPTIPLRLLPLPGTERFLQPVTALDRVRYVGEPVAVRPALAKVSSGPVTLKLPSTFNTVMRYLCLPPRGSAIDCRWRCRKVILWLCAPISGFRHQPALDAARPHLSEPAGLGPCGRPDRRVAQDLRRVGLAACCHGRFSRSCVASWLSSGLLSRARSAARRTRARPG